ncbi:MAG: 4Fe-4S dicluster domain-containing protein [Planctomycetota bacterium]|jgi:heterodisulfide reductase subunit C
MNVILSAEKLKNEKCQKLKELSNENVYTCYQCGNCSAGCPAADFMDLAPHQVIRLAQLGMVEEILQTNTMWICAACITCRVRCPKGVDLSKIMEALRQIVLRDKKNYVHLNEIKKELLDKLPQIALVSNFRKFTL